MLLSQHNVRTCIGLTCAIMLSATACGPSTDDATTPTAAPAESTATTDLTPPTPASPNETSPMTEPTRPTSPVENSGIDVAVADLATRLDLDPGAIDVVSVVDVTWSDGSIGCPQPGMSYTQALVPGTLIILEFEGTSYEYHGAGDRPPFFCPPERARPPTGLADPGT